MCMQCPQISFFLIFNRNAIKLSYSYMTNMKQKIDNHTKKRIMTNEKNKEKFTRTCNTRYKTSCPLRKMSVRGSCVQGHCNTNRINKKKKQDTYIGMTKTHFKKRYNLHKSSLRLPHKRSATTLSENVWKLEDASIGDTTEWTL